jgi:neutral trehalase
VSNFTYKIVGQRRRLKAIKAKKIVPQKLNVILFFDRIF